MPNKNYLRGRRLEYELVHRAREHFESTGKKGWAQRMAGSHSPYDLIIFNETQKIIELVQCKTKVIEQSKIDKCEEMISEPGWNVLRYKRTKFIQRRKK